ncbi:helix-turn-helix domain-containing protein [Psychromicrobium xiongbiense]|uniref:helix-turn-helix domain-containing protein n=1 Tax=Psychromicrobium xiongbiense TaxID=3051184 RepID=UPI002554987E|nr:helix-turn-helix domain-containing protein [Psychromicrobium sp. YIM S02556]
MPRFLTLADVSEQLQISSPAAYALVRSGELPAIQVGGRGQWRVEETMLEQYIQDRYADTQRLVAQHQAAQNRDPATH